LVKINVLISETRIIIRSFDQIFHTFYWMSQLFQGLEIYCSESSSNPHIYLSFRNQAQRDNLHDKLLKEPALKLEELDQDVMTLQWQNGIISNYDYLLYINR
jgi:hypothetical protein